MKKYKLTSKTKEHFGITLYQIEALKDFGNVKKGDKGGWIEKESNLSQEDGDAWVYGDALVSGNAEVYGNAEVSGNAEVYGNAKVSKKIKLTGGYFYHTKEKSEKIDIIETCDNDNETLCKNPIIEK